MSSVLSKQNSAKGFIWTAGAISTTGLKERRLPSFLEFRLWKLGGFVPMEYRSGFQI